ncbi:MAG: hypothetical protein KME43_03520 [Myxacorys chilensis ATA2-1-KO14]|jgi:uncharacterized protein YneR|nr:hypothetical protein [Myxacorys chilensis ATA2-1-KO14]
MDAKTRETLELFVEKARVLEDRSFTKLIMEHGLSFEIKVGSSSQIEHTIPERESIKASIVTLRMFVQNNDPISIENISNLLNEPTLSREWKELFIEKRDQLNSYLDHSGGIGIVVDEKEFTNREIFDTFVYGSIAHSAKNHRPRYQQWKSLGRLSFSIDEYAFAVIVMDILTLIWEIADATELELGGSINLQEGRQN